MTTSTATPGSALRFALVAGYAGSGKSEAGKLLASATGWSMLDKDTLTRPLTERLLVALGSEEDDRHTQTYLEHVRPLEYDCLLKAAWENLECGISVVAVAPFIKEVTDAAWINRVTRRCRASGAQLETFWVDSDADSMRARLISRNASRDSWKLAHWADYLRTMDLALRPAAPHHSIDNRMSASRPLAEQVESVAQQLAAEVPV